MQRKCPEKCTMPRAGASPFGHNGGKANRVKKFMRRSDKEKRPAGKFLCGWRNKMQDKCLKPAKQNERTSVKRKRGDMSHRFSQVKRRKISKIAVDTAGKQCYILWQSQGTQKSELPPPCDGKNVNFLQKRRVFQLSGGIAMSVIKFVKTLFNEFSEAVFELKTTKHDDYTY